MTTTQKTEETTLFLKPEMFSGIANNDIRSTASGMDKDETEEVGDKDKEQETEQEQPVEFKPNPEQERAGKAAQSAIKTINQSEANSKSWDKWMVVAEGYSAAKEYAKDKADGKTAGKKYTQAHRAFCQHYGLDAIHKATRSHLVRCFEQKDEVEKWRTEQAKAGNHLNLNNPSLVWAAFKKPPAGELNLTEYANGLTTRYGRNPLKVAKDITFKFCPKDGGTGGAVKLAEVANLLHGYSVSGREQERHLGKQFIGEIADALKA